MFRHKTENIIIPQYEHLKMVGLLAQHWGNDDFSLPELPTEDFITACYTHDLGFGTISNDTYEIGNMSEKQRKEVVKKCVNVEFASDTTQMIVARHFLRLLSFGSYKFPELKELLNQQIDVLKQKVDITESVFDHADTIIDLLDAISFDFSSGVSSDYTVNVFQDSQSDRQVEIGYTIQDSNIILTHWPFSANQIEGSIIAYQSDDYPNTLVPVLKPYTVTKE